MEIELLLNDPWVIEGLGMQLSGTVVPWHTQGPGFNPEIQDKILPVRYISDTFKS
jgi:hypothetical protein